MFTVIAKDNIDLNSRSSTATMDYHETGFSLIQMHSEESEGTVYNYIYTMDDILFQESARKSVLFCLILQCITHPSM